MVAYTTTYNFAKPTVGDDEGVWGGYLNGNFDSIENLLKGTTALTSLSLTGTFTIDNSTQTSFNVEYANDDAGVGPVLRTFRDSASPAIGDALGGIDFRGNNSAGTEKFYARIKGVITDPTDTSEDGAVEISVSKAGTAAWETSALVAKFDPDGMELRGDLRFEGATADNFKTTLTVTDPTADRTITLPNATGTAVLSTTLIEGTSFSGTYPVLFGIDNATGRVFENNSILYNGTSNVLTISGNTVWHAGNDGAGSGLDADLLDGNHASAFVLKSGDTMTGNLTIDQGTAGDAILKLRSDTDNNDEADHPSIEFLQDGDLVGFRIGIGATNTDTSVAAGGNGFTITNTTSNSQSSFYWSPDNGTNAYPIWHSGNDGSGSGLDADLLDGNHASAFQTASTALSYVDVATGNYGTIKVDDDRGVTWAGYAIRDDWVFMSNGAGNCGIYNDTDNEWAIYITQNGSVQLRYNGATTLETTSGGAAVTGALTATGDITAYFSDERLKDFDGKIEGALDKVSQLNGYYYRENDKAKELGFDNDARQIGVSAQEVEAVLPEVIKPAPVDPEYKTVQYERLVPLLIEAIKELKEEVRQLKEDKA